MKHSPMILLLLVCMAACQSSMPEPLADAQWIGSALNDRAYLNEQGRTCLPARYYRLDFSIEGLICQAVLHISAPGVSETKLNGQPVSPDIMGTLPSDYDRTVYYNTYDVTDLLQRGDNSLTITQGSGYFVGMIKHYNIWLTPFYGEPRLRAQLVVRTTRGTKVFSSSPQWLVSESGPITCNNLYDGETYDAHREIITDWHAADTLPAPKGTLLAQPIQGMRIWDRIHPVAVWTLPNGHIMVDMGTNMVGWLQIHGRGQEDQAVIMRFGETMLPDNTGVYQENLRSARCTNTYIPAVSDTFTYCPKTVYQGFRYIEITGLTAEPSTDDLTGIIFYDDVPRTATFECSNPLLNQIFMAAVNGIRGNYHGFPTDCPQRDERLGWLGDRVTGCYGESMLFDNRDYYLKWLQDIADTQNEEGQIADIAPQFWAGVRHDNVTWTCAYIYVAHMLYERFGDDRGIRRYYDSMRRYVLYTLDKGMKDSIMTIDTYGDWCMPPEREELVHSQDPTRKTEAAVLSSTVMYDVLLKMQSFATMLDKTEDAAFYATTAQNLRNAYNRQFYNPTTGGYSNNTVTANVLSYDLDLVPDSLRNKVMQQIVYVTENTFNSHVSCGVLGIQHLMRCLTRNRHADLAYRIATQTTYPSWGYMMEHGATTIWELWNGNTAAPSMNSGNHVMLLGDLMLWYMEDLAGIRPSSPAYKTLHMQPCFPADLSFVSATYASPSGPISSAWKRTGSGDIEWDIELPKGVEADVYLPSQDVQHIQGKKHLVFAIDGFAK